MQILLALSLVFCHSKATQATPVKRFIKVFTLLIVSLFLIVSGIDAALDHLTHSPTQSSFTVYSEQGGVVLAYDGDLALCKPYTKTGPAVVPNFLHRT